MLQQPKINLSDFLKTSPWSPLLNISSFVHWLKNSPSEVKDILESEFPTIDGGAEERSGKRKKKSLAEWATKLANRIEDGEEECVEINLEQVRVLKVWTNLYVYYKQTRDRIELGRQTVNLKKLEAVQKTGWIKRYVVDKMKRREKETQDLYMSEAEQRMIKQHEQDLFEDDILQLRDEFLEDDKTVTRDSGSTERALLSLSLSKTVDERFSQLTPSSVDTYYLFKELLNQFLSSSIPEWIGGELYQDLNFFDQWYSDYKTFFTYQKEYYGYMNDLLWNDELGKLVEKETAQKLILTANELLIPLDDEVKYLEFSIKEYDDWMVSFSSWYESEIEHIDAEISFWDFPERFEWVQKLAKEIPYLSWIGHSDKEPLMKMWSVDWMVKAESLMEGMHKTLFYNWIDLAEELNEIDTEAYLEKFAVYQEFENEYNFGNWIRELCSGKKADWRRIKPEDLEEIISKTKESPIFLDEELDQLMNEVQEFNEKQAQLLKLMLEKGDIDEIEGILNDFEKGPWAYKDEKQNIKKLRKKVDSLRYKMVSSFPQFFITHINSGIDTKSLRSLKISSAVKRQKALTMAQRAELRKEKINTIKEVKKKKSIVCSVSQLESSETTSSKCSTPRKNKKLTKRKSSGKLDQIENLTSKWEFGISLLSEYLILDCSFKEGEIFKTQLDKERVRFDAIRRSIWKVEWALNGQFDYRGNIEEIDDSEDETKSTEHRFKPETEYFKYLSQPENPQLVEILEKAKTQRAEEFSDVEIDQSEKNLFDYEKLWIEIQTLRDDILNSKVDFDIEGNESLSIIDSLELRLFIRIYQLQMHKPRESLLKNQETLQSSSSEILPLKNEIENLFDQSEDHRVIERSKPIRGEAFIPKIDFDYITTEWWDRNFLSEDQFYMLTEEELEWFKNIINDIHRINSRLNELKSFSPLDAFKTLTFEDFIIDFSREIEKKKGRLRRSAKVSTQKMAKKVKVEKNEEHRPLPKSKSSKSKKPRKILTPPKQFHGDFIVMEDKDEEFSDSWILKIEIRKKKRERKLIRKTLQKFPPADFSEDDYELPKPKVTRKFWKSRKTSPKRKWSSKRKIVIDH
jgi:hypothetical protein